MKSLFLILPIIMFTLSSASAIFLYGAYAYKVNLFPIPQLKSVKSSLSELYNSLSGEIIYVEVPGEVKGKAVTHLSDRLSSGLILVMGVAENRENFIRVIDRAGTIIHELRPDWFDIWKPEEGSFPKNRRPKGRPGALLHGLDILQSGDVVFNFEHLSTMRMDFCGEVIWKLDNLGHHSVHAAEDGTIWVSAETYYDQNPTGHRNHNAPLRSWTLQHISPEGEVLKTIPVIDILRKNELEGLLSLSTLSNRKTEVEGDTLHLNDIETFPSRFNSEVFAAGDIMFSLRNINTIIVMDPESQKIKFHSTGEVLRQHDPDFMDGDLISIFDNNNLMPSGGIKNQFSRIIEIGERISEKKVVVDGSGETQFFTDIMGTHQRLPNGNLLINSSGQGRVLETLSDGVLVWEYTNRVTDTKAGRLTMAMLLPPHMDVKYFETRRTQCL